MANLKVTKSSKEGNKSIPEGAKILNKDITTNVEEIENGFIITKNTEIKYEYESGDGDKRTDWTYITKKWYSKEDPLTINIKDKSLSEAFDG